MMAGESLAEHSVEIWIVLVGVIAIFVSLLVYIYKGLVKRIDRIPENLVTRDDLERHCREARPACPVNNQLDQVAKDTKAIREDMKKIMDKQEKLREETLPREYLTIVNYEKEQTKLAEALRESINSIKVLISGMGTISDIKIIFNEKIDEIRQACNKQ